MDVSIALFIQKRGMGSEEEDNDIGMVDGVPHAFRSDSANGERWLKPKLLKTKLGLVGDVRGKDVVIVDDLIDSGRSKHAEYLKKAGARRIFFPRMVFLVKMLRHA